MRPLSIQVLPRVCAGRGASDICTRARYLARLLSADSRFEALSQVAFTSSKQHRIVFISLLELITLSAPRAGRERKRAPEKSDRRGYEHGRSRLQRRAPDKSRVRSGLTGFRGKSPWLDLRRE